MSALIHIKEWIKTPANSIVCKQEFRHEMLLVWILRNCMSLEVPMSYSLPIEQVRNGIIIFKHRDAEVTFTAPKHEAD